MPSTHIHYSIIAIFVALAMAHVVSQIAPHLSAFRPGASLSVSDTQQQAKAKLVPQATIIAPARYGEYRIQADSMGQYSADVEINGSRIRHMLVDTGATMVALSYEDAAAIGLYPLPSEYKYTVSTANGSARVAKVKLHDVRLGSLVVHDVEALVGERGALASSLLGMTFLGKLSRLEVASGALILRQ